MRKIVALALTLVALVVVLGRPASGQQGYRIVVHPDNPEDSLLKATVADMFRKKKTRWDSGDLPVIPVDLPPKSDVREAFSRDIHGRSATSVVSWWQKQIFSGRGKPPLEVATDREVIDFVRRTPGAVGYVSQSAELNGVKVLVTGS